MGGMGTTTTVAAVSVVANGNAPLGFVELANREDPTDTGAAIEVAQMVIDSNDYANTIHVVAHWHIPFGPLGRTIVETHRLEEFFALAKSRTVTRAHVCIPAPAALACGLISSFRCVEAFRHST